uniref:Uncharacterized protein n=1 Tax=Physcomitrium patens TaxID=3218 RepID=A0A2K1IJ67_PHYPA|nr:hypothetical protein PHYPA_028006 [Physcomitrium patens]
MNLLRTRSSSALDIFNRCDYFSRSFSFCFSSFFAFFCVFFPPSKCGRWILQHHLQLRMGLYPDATLTWTLASDDVTA